jgi:hypothetical protein
MKIETSLRVLLQSVFREHLNHLEASQPDETMVAWDKQVAAKTGWCHFLQTAEWAKI